MDPLTPGSATGEDEKRTSDTGVDRRIGQLVDGKYVILRRLACGGMGSVYEARHCVVGRHFALKFLHDQYAKHSGMLQRFLREAQAAGSIASEHIIGVLDYGSADGIPYLVMELVRGQDLRELLAETPRLEERRAVRIVLDACRGLSLAHERGLIHRDLKPANICVTWRSDGREVAKVIDFGVAKLRDGVELSEEGTLIGTIGYMAPEQLTDHRQTDVRADIYALGVILYQALAGQPPHVCQRSELLFRIVSVDPPRLSEIASDVSPGLSAVVERALARNREQRFPTIREFARALEPYAEDTTPAAELPPRSLPRASAVELGTAITELESAPTWAALSDLANGAVRAARGDERSYDRQCDRESGNGSPAGDELCRQVSGVSPLPSPARDRHLSQRALLLSVGALALSVVAMTTMFVFVYSQGSRALEPAAHRSSSSAVAELRARALPAGSVQRGPPVLDPPNSEWHFMASAADLGPPASSGAAPAGSSATPEAREGISASNSSVAEESPLPDQPSADSGWRRASVAHAPEIENVERGLRSGESAPDPISSGD
jgi:serine/threonine protein kinase